MHILIIILLIGAAVCFAVSAFAVAKTRVNLLALGLLLWVLVPLLQALGA